MINHARTLLLNIDGEPAGYGQQPGDEFVPPTYLAAVLPSYLQQVHKVLFGSGPDRIQLNYRVRQCLGLLHRTELVEFVTDLDPRITYDVLPADELFDSLFQTVVQPLADTTDQLFIQGKATKENTGEGRLQDQWLLTRTSSSQVEMVYLSRPSVLTESAILFYTHGLSSRIDLPGEAGLGFKLEEGTDGSWYIESTVRPVRSLDQILAELDVLTEDIRLELFGVGSSQGSTEPFRTFRNLYRYHPELHYRLGGLLLATIYQTDLLVKESATSG